MSARAKSRASRAAVLQEQISQDLVSLGMARWKREVGVRRKEGTYAPKASAASGTPPDETNNTLLTPMSWSVSTTTSLVPSDTLSSRKAKSDSSMSGAMRERARGVWAGWATSAAEARLEFSYQALQQYRTAQQQAVWRQWHSGLRRTVYGSSQSLSLAFDEAGLHSSRTPSTLSSIANV